MTPCASACAARSGCAAAPSRWRRRSLLELNRTRFRPTVDLVAFSSFAQVGTEIGFISNLPTIGDLSFNCAATAPR